MNKKRLVVLCSALLSGALISTLGVSAPKAQEVTQARKSIFPAAPRRLSLSQREPWGDLPPTPKRLPAGFRAWHRAGLAPIRGMTIGPIESHLQPGRGYGSEPFDETLGEINRMGADWISLTAFGRVWDKKSAGVDLVFEQPTEVTRAAILRSIKLAHQRGMRVLLVPHLWLESGEWRAEMFPETKERFENWVKSYIRFVTFWAEVAEEGQAEMFAAGVELRSWVTTSRAPSFIQVLAEIRKRYSGLVTYAANWDDVDDTVIWGHLDVIGINAFYQLHWEDDATWKQVEAGGQRVAQTVEELARRHERPVVFTEFGYTTRKNTAIKPWLWPEQLGRVAIDQTAQARAYAALLGAMKNVPGFAGAFVWRMYADITDMSQEAEWGFSPWGKESQTVLMNMFADRNFGDPPPPLGAAFRP